MRKYLLLILVLFMCFIFVGCNPDSGDDPGDDPGNTDDDPLIQEHVCEDNLTDWIDDNPFTCGETGYQHKECTICGEWIESKKLMKRHEYEEIVVKEATCTENGQAKRICKNCEAETITTLYKTGHKDFKLVVTKQPSLSEAGEREARCVSCDETLRTLAYVNNGYNFNGKLRVEGADLVNKSGMKYQLFGLSTHGLQWFGSYANFDTIASLQESFGINVIRFAFYTDENGYCDGGEAKQKAMLEDLHRGIAAATKLGLYVIVDWHMVGAENPADKNPLTYLEQSKEFFEYMAKYYKNQNNILYEIMNEPNGTTTWADCKKYANEVIPVIRKYTDAVVLVGNPKWTADLVSVMADPLFGYRNIMYTYHFYAGDHKNTSQVVNAYDNGFPVFISEFGFMNSDGDGAINETSGQNWMKILDERNISYVAWNISNSKGSASIFKQGSTDMVDVSDSNLKEWGIYLKRIYRLKSGLDME